MAEKYKDYHIKYFSLCITLVLLVSVCSISDNAFADQINATVDVGPNPWSIAVNQNTNMIYVRGDTVDGYIDVINGSTNQVQNVIGATSHNGWVTINPTTNRIYVSNAYPGPHYSVSVIDGFTNALITNIPVNEPGALAVNPDTNKIYFTNYGSNISVIDGATNSVIDTIAVGSAPFGIAVNQNTNMIYTANSGSNTVSVINGTTNSVTETIPVDTFPESIAVNPFTNMIYVSNSGANSISVINGTTNHIVATIPTTSFPTFITVNPITNKIYFSLTTSGIVEKVDGKTNTIIQNIFVGDEPFGLGINPLDNMIYAVEQQHNIQPFNGHVSIIRGISTPSAPTGLVANPRMPPQITLSWIVPSDNGDSAIIGYKVERSLDNGTSWNTIVQNTNNTGTTYTDSHLMPVKTYTYRVSAINDIGTSLPSHTASARPLSAHVTTKIQ